MDAKITRFTLNKQSFENIEKVSTVFVILGKNGILLEHQILTKRVQNLTELDFSLGTAREIHN